MSTSPCAALPANLSHVSRPWLLRLLDRVLAANAQHRQHQALLQMDDHILSDIGITRTQAIEQATRPVWNAPNHWKS